MRTSRSEQINDRQLSKWDYFQRDTAEREEEARVSSSQRIVETDSTKQKEHRMLEEILSFENLRRYLSFSKHYAQVH